MAANGINAVRTYTVPPRWFLDLASEHGLLVKVGIPWEQHVAFLDQKWRARSIEERVRAAVAACAGHPAILCYAVGNEIPAPIVRWHGARRTERFLERLHAAAKSEDPEGLVTYVNYPSTEYLELPFLDIACFNVYLEAQRPLEAYLARLHSLSGDRPVMLAELGLDSRRHGENTQARTLEWQIHTSFGSGCAGAFVFAWTDEWHRGGHDIDNWDFGITRRDRSPKSALAAVRRAYAEVPFPHELQWPPVSVVVCTHNGARTLRRCLRALSTLDYPDFEVIVVDDGSTDDTAAIADQQGFPVIRTANRGLANARNTGIAAATGDILAYIDDDAYPDPHWLRYLAASFLRTGHAAVGGPNIAADGGGTIADCVANSPGGPIHVLLSDREAEHIPGCNMAFRKSRLEAVGGFDPQFRAAGDDVDICWRLRERGETIGFNASAMVWHQPRSSVRAYWKQQRTYGDAEAALERKWPQKYNALGHPHWIGRLYDSGAATYLRRPRGGIRYGTWGTGLFQSVYQPAERALAQLPLMPEWFLFVAALATIGAIGALWAPLFVALPLLAAAIGVAVVGAALSAARTSSRSFRRVPARARRLKLVTLTAALHLVQPLARLRGRVGGGLGPWRRIDPHGLVAPRPRTSTIWSERPRAIAEWLGSLEASLLSRRAATRRGGECDRWDLEVRGGMLGAVRTRMALEDHGGGRQLLRFRSWPRWSAPGVAAALLFAVLALGAALDGAWIAAALLAGVTALVAARWLWESGGATAVLLAATGALLEGTERTKPSTRFRAPAQGRELRVGGR
jgi:GT2 family glycosyltransferase